VRRFLLSSAIMLAIAVAILLAAEGTVRVLLRLRTGTWPSTLAVGYADWQLDTRTRLYRRHPFLLIASRENARDAHGERIYINSLGYRSPERPREKALGVRRVVCSGGSTTYDVRAYGNAATWPGRLEAALVTGGRRVEVWNAGFPGWTTLENLIALASRDVDLAPDLVILYQGINDLQPLSEEPIEPQYDGFHAQEMLTGLGFDGATVPWYRRSVLAELTNQRLGFDRRAIPEPPRRTPRTSLSGEALRIFDRNVRSFVAVAVAHGARVLLVTQSLVLRADHVQADEEVYRQWIPALDPRTGPAALEQLNDVLRKLAVEMHVSLADAARDVAWADADFIDPMHMSARGSGKLAAFLAPIAAPLLEAPGSPGERIDDR
jgi:lysophospholipase L1-like esterase